jgi:2,3-bisphosphoglycerate-dependent phosphoglycerate mutase
VHDPQSRPLTEKGLNDRAVVEKYLADKKIDVILSSPFKRAYDTVASFAEVHGLPVEIIDDFRERLSDSNWMRDQDFLTFIERQWNDFDYTLSDGESLAVVQKRNINALIGVLRRYRDKNIVIGTHGTALSTIINYYDASYGFSDFMKIIHVMPWAVKMVFDAEKFCTLEMLDIMNGEGV